MKKPLKAKKEESPFKSFGPFDHVRMLHKHEHTDDLTGYDPYLINKALSFTKDTILYANEMNMNYELDVQLQYDYLYHSIRPGKRTYQWVKAPKEEDEDSDFSVVQAYYGYNNEKTRQALAILDKMQLDKIRNELIKGGT
jgi:Bacteriophage clamp loader A subunit